MGTAGGKTKCDWVKNELGFDGVIDYHSEDERARLSALCPDGIDVFFDNVGGVVLNEVLARLRLKARIVLCGAISRYNDATPAPGPSQGRDPRRGALSNGRLHHHPRLCRALSRSDWCPCRLAEGGQTQTERRRGHRAGEFTENQIISLLAEHRSGKQLLKIADPPLERMN